MKTKFTTVLLTIVLLLTTLVTPVFAADSSITFEGTNKISFKPGSEYTTSDLFDGFKNVMPGDVRTEQITIENIATTSDYIEVYMRAEAHSEDGNSPEAPLSAGETVDLMNEFLSKLTMKIRLGETLIYDSTPDQTAQLTENTHIATLRNGQSVTLDVELTVPADLGNEFAYFVGEVDWVFTVEEKDDDGYFWVPFTIKKVWDDNNYEDRPEYVDVDILRNGHIFDTVRLSDKNGWCYSFTSLTHGFSWTCVEDVPEGYAAKYTTFGNRTTITNKLIEQKPAEETTPEENDPIEDEPIIDEEPVEIPEDPIEETPEVEEPVVEIELFNMTVTKAWDDDGKNRPTSAKVALMNGDEIVESVVLSAENNWTHTWKDLEANENYHVVETEVPDGYTPYYSVQGGEVVITNTATLIQTGQNNMPIIVLGAAGALLIVIGAVYLTVNGKKTKKNRA